MRPSSALAYPTETYDLNSGTKAYSQFLTNLRTRLEATKACNIRVTQATLPADAEYVYVNLKVTAAQWVTLAIRVDNVYLVAYRVGGQTKGTFFNELDVRSARSKLFDKNDNQPTLQYDSNYNSIQAVGGSRKDLALGIQELRKKIVAFYDHRTPVSAAEVARFLLMSIQMVSEAARFKYIETLVVNSGSSKAFKPDDKMIDLETNWGKISKAVHQSNEQVPNKCVTISPPIVIAGKKWNLVSDVKIDVILLKYKSNDANSCTSGHQLFSTMVASYINKAAGTAGGVGDSELAILEDSFVCSINQ
ncbi:antiviral protein MAP-like [Beta vulgaris subsp. vulgaris]|uniref:antiviral protein MAP-like n=1 Tax=Beta vulgaris subsp. vulgaris TaxID=3555 RepID=UPI002036A99C|nr:antiviral protein MAP-like [Beta vulgaris subsp. vulgaris]